MKQIHVIALCLGVAVFVVLVTNYFTQPSVVGVTHIPTTLKVGLVPGFDTNQTSLSFGKVPKNAASTRILEVHNEFDFDVLFVLQIDAPFQSWVSFNTTVGILIPHQSQHIHATAQVPSNAILGNYSGMVYVVFSQPRWKRFIR